MHDHGQHELQAFRAAKDAYFGQNPHSPLGHEERHQFEGLSYYPFNPDPRLELALDRNVPAAVVTVETSTGESHEYQRAGVVHFTVEGQAAALTVYQAVDGKLFLPVRDATSGEETYGAGRYRNRNSSMMAGCWWTSTISTTLTALTTRPGVARCRRGKTGAACRCALVSQFSRA